MDSLIPLFKYGSIISVPLFVFVNLILLITTPKFSFTKLTVCKSIFLYKQPWKRNIFVLNFYLKAILDFTFVPYLLNFLSLPFYSLIGLTWISSIITFGLTAYITEDENYNLHQVMAYATAALLAISQFAISIRLGNTGFIQFTIANIILDLSLAYWEFKKNNTNTFIQAGCMLVLYVWLIIFVKDFLQ